VRSLLQSCRGAGSEVAATGGRTRRGPGRQEGLRGAIAQFDAAIRLDPGDAYAYSQRGFAYYRTGDLELALKDVNEALKHDPRAAGAYNTRGLVQHAARLRRGARRSDAGHSPRSLVSNLYSNRGRTYNARKQFDRAIQDLNESIRLHPANSRPYMERAISHENKRERDKALADWRTTLRLDPDNQSAAKAIAAWSREKVGSQGGGENPRRAGHRQFRVPSSATACRTRSDAGDSPTSAAARPSR